MSTQSTGLYRPPQWSANGVAMVSITVPNAALLSDSSDSTDSGPVTYVFDAVLELEHEQQLEITHHPVQTGADISSHAYLLPATCAMFVGMSDAMDSYASTPVTAPTLPYQYPNYMQWTGATSKSVSAYQTMLSLQASRIPLTVTTRLRTYTNMVVMSVSPREDFKTITGLRMRVVFRQIFTGSVTTSTGVQTSNTVRADASDMSGLGAVNPSAVSTATQKQFAQPTTSVSNSTLGVDKPTQNFMNYIHSSNSGVNCPGAGNYSSKPGQDSIPIGAHS
jgi:hypothetical protein